MTTFNKLLENLDYLNLEPMRESLIQIYSSGKLSEETLSILDKMTSTQVEVKKNNSRLYNVKVAAFPYIKTLDDFEFDFQPSIKREYFESLLASDFISRAENVIFIGSPGVGKNLLSIAIASDIAARRNAVYFIKFSKLISQLKIAYDEELLGRRIKNFNKYKILVIDEIGFNEISPLEAKLFFQLIDSRYEKRSVIITSNITFDKWDKIFGNDEMLTRAILDRILYHSHIINISGNPYRIKDKLTKLT